MKKPEIETPPKNPYTKGVKPWRHIAAAATVLSIALTIYISFTWNSPLPPLEPEHQNTTPTLTEFADFQCPHCAHFATEIYPQLKEDFIDTNRIHFRYRHFPFINPSSYISALASECARDQNNFIQFHDIIFSQDYLTNPEDDPEKTYSAMNQTAAELRLNTTEFSSCLQEQRHYQTIITDLKDASKLGVQGTPSLFLEEKPINWTDYPTLKRQLNKSLNH